VAPGSLRREPIGWLRRYGRRARRLLAMVVALGLLGAIMIGALLLITPATGNAPAVAQAFARAHGAPYPGPPVPAKLAASLAAENVQLYSGADVVPISLGRVALGSITGRPGAGVTLDQQLAKLLYTPGRAGVVAGAEQALLGVKLSFGYPKRAILQMYAAVAYFGHGYYGLAPASCGYFGISPDRLSWAQAALLAGLALAPSQDDPFAHPSNARAAEARVLARLAATRTLTRGQAARAYRKPLHLTDGRVAACASS
jgi:membrane peptidoglycan carboxypeptidase